MAALKTKWAEMSWYRRALLIVMAVEILAFLFANIAAAIRPGLEYEDTLLYPRTEGNLQIYQGTIDGETARFTVSPEGEISYQWGEYSYGPYQITEDPSAAPEGLGRMTGLEISLGDEILFRGGYQPNSVLSLYQEDGEPLWSIRVSATMSDGTVIGEDGRVISPKEQHEPTLFALVRVALDPELTRQGNILLYLLITVLAVFNMLQICFPGFFFRHSIRWHVRDPELAEPSDFYIAMERMEWIVLAIVCLVLYSMCLTTIYT